jgi:flagellar biosynthesis chaperone FliJ
MMNDIQDKVLTLSHITQEIVVYEEIIDLLQTQVAFYKKRLTDKKEELSEAHRTLLSSNEVLIERPLTRIAENEKERNGV